MTSVELVNKAAVPRTKAPETVTMQMCVVDARTVATAIPSYEGARVANSKGMRCLFFIPRIWKPRCV